VCGRYAGTEHKELVRLLHACNEKLKKYAHVNKKAFDQVPCLSLCLSV
jgi:hypothetical protein